LDSESESESEPEPKLDPDSESGSESESVLEPLQKKQNKKLRINTAASANLKTSKNNKMYWFWKLDSKTGKKPNPNPKLNSNPKLN